MAKRIKKVTAMLIVAFMSLGMIAPQALAAETTTTTDTQTTTEGGVTTTVTTTTETTVDGDTTTIVVTVNTNKTGTDENGVEVNFNETAVDTTIVTQQPDGGSTTTDTTVIDGSETLEYDEIPEGMELPEDYDPDVTLELIPGESNSATLNETASSTTQTPITGEDGGTGIVETTTTVTTDRVVTGTATETETVVETQGTSEMTPLIPDRTIDDDGDLSDEQLLEEYTYSGGFNDTDPVASPGDGYDYRFNGFGQMSMWGNATVDGRTGALQFELQYDPDFDPENGEDPNFPEDRIYLAYCADIDTGAIDNYWYRIDALEDAGYYDEESASYIRAIALNGYWGTSNTPDENGNYQLGSLEALKEGMKAAVADGTLTGITIEEIDSITEGQALNATQSAIWMYANSETDGTYVDTERLITKGYAADKSERVDPSPEDHRNASAVFNYLMGLDPIERPEHSEIIDEDAYIVEDSMSITVGDKVEDAAENEDDNDDNDVYDVSLNFALVVSVDNESDDLIVQVVGIDAEGNPYTVAQGRIAGGDAEEDAQNNFNPVSYDEATGTYTLENLSLAENSDFNFDLKLVGTQHLEQGVYIFTSEVRNDVSSQTFVSIVEGESEVNVSKGYSITFNVDEESHVVVEQSWHYEEDPTAITPPPGNDPPPQDDDTPPPPEDEFDPPVPGEEIPDEEVPLADVPYTGDDSSMWLLVIAPAGMGLVALKLSDKKREDEEI